MAEQSASDLVEELAGLGEEIHRRTVAETRKYVALEVEEHFLGGSNVSRRTFGGMSPDDCIFEALKDFPTLRDQRLQALRDRFDDEGISEDFRVGILFAVRLFADPEYDY